MGIYSELFNRLTKTARVFPTSSQEILRDIYDEYKSESKPSRQFLHNMRNMSGIKLVPNATREQKDLAEAKGYEVHQQRQAELRKIKAQSDVAYNKELARGFGSAVTHPVTTYTDFYNSTIAPAINKGVTSANTAFWNSGVGKAVGKGLDLIYGKRPPEVK